MKSAVTTRDPENTAKPPLIAAKSTLPPTPADYVERPRLEARLERAVEGRLTLVTGPAGSGKTTLLTGWAHRRGGVAWLTLDEFDNDPAGLWDYLIAALPHHVTHPPVKGALAAALTGWLSRLDRPVVFVLDNVESLTDRPAQAMIAALLRPGLPHLRLVLASRKPLPLQVGRLRLAGEVTEIGPDDLAFTAEEAPAELVARTDGLAVAISLAAKQTAKQTANPTAEQAVEPTAQQAGERAGEQVAAGQGDNDTLDAFIRSEIFEPLPDLDRDFLLRTSVVESMSPELAAGLTERGDAGATLERLRQQGLACWTDESRTQLRIRRPLLDFVRREARIVIGDELAKRHQWAAQWLAEHSRPLPAARHAVLAEDWPLAAELAIRHTVPELFGPNASELREVLAALPASEAVHHPEVAAGIALLGVDRADLDTAEAYTGLARKHLASLPRERAMPLRAALDLVTLLADRQREDFRAVETGARGLMARLKGPKGCLVPAAARLNTVALAALGTVRLWAGQVAEARDLLTGSAEAASAAGLDLVAVDARGKLAVLQALRGDVSGAVALSEGTATAPARVALAIAHWLRGENEAALAHLPDHPDSPSGKLMVAMVRARVLISQRKSPAARAALAGAQEWAGGDPATALLDDWLATTRAALHLEEGRPINALNVLNASNGGPDGHDSPLNQQARILAARACLAGSAPARALNLAEAARRDGLAPWPEVDSWLVSAVAAEQLGREGLARIALAEAVAVASADGAGLAQPLLDAGPALRALMEANRDLLAGFSWEETRDDLRLVEPLTEREADVLRYLPTLLRRNDIARELSVSANTVKAHVRSLYHKLGVGSRRDAVARARALGLLR